MLAQITFTDVFSLIKSYWPISIAVVLWIIWLARGLLRSLIGHFLGFRQELEALASKKKSYEVRYGKLGEVLAPIAEAFPVDVRAEGSTTIFLGQPVDYLHFAADGTVHFIEIKTGGARLAAVQQRIKSAVQSGKVIWDEMRLD